MSYESRVAEDRRGYSVEDVQDLGVSKNQKALI